MRMSDCRDELRGLLREEVRRNHASGDHQLTRAAGGGYAARLCKQAGPGRVSVARADPRCALLLESIGSVRRGVVGANARASS
jgi:hypothetical protein